MTNNKSFKPVNVFLSKYVDRFYSFDRTSDAAFELPPILPGTGLELLFYDGTPLSIQGVKLSKSHIVCPRHINYFDKTKQVSFLSVRFKSGAFRHFSPIPFLDLNNQYISSTTLWGDAGQNLIKELDDLIVIEDKIRALEHFLIKIFKQYHQSENLVWDSIIDELYYNFSSRTIESLSKKTGLSLRQFERNFKYQFGLTPKVFQRISRFQNTIKHIIFNQTSDQLQAVFDNGYFDQSHFIKEFKNFTHQRPSQYFSPNSLSHFYHESIK